MTNRPKAIGTQAESALVRYARANGFPNAERLVLHGAADQGDVRLCGRFDDWGQYDTIIVEVKAGHAAEQASDAQIERWLAETERERVNAGAQEALLVTKRKGHGKPNGWWVHWHNGYHPCRARLDDVLAMLRADGYGTEEAA